MEQYQTTKWNEISQLISYANNTANWLPTTYNVKNENIPCPALSEISESISKIKRAIRLLIEQLELSTQIKYSKDKENEIRSKLAYANMVLKKLYELSKICQQFKDPADLDYVKRLEKKNYPTYSPHLPEQEPTKEDQEVRESLKGIVKQKACGFITLKEYAGGDKWIKMFEPLIDMWQFPKQKDTSWYDVRSNLFLFGPAGTGKTLLAEALAGELQSRGLNVTMLSATTSQVLSKFVGTGSKAIRIIFEMAKEYMYVDEEHPQGQYPVILFWDEIDGLIGQSGGVEGGQQDLLTEFKNQTGTTQPWNKSLIVIAATNRPAKIAGEILDRFHRFIYVGLPDASAIRKLFIQRIKKMGKHYFNIPNINYSREAFIGDINNDIWNKIINLLNDQLESKKVDDKDKVIKDKEWDWNFSNELIKTSKVDSLDLISYMLTKKKFSNRAITLKIIPDFLEKAAERLKIFISTSIDPHQMESYYMFIADMRPQMARLQIKGKCEDFTKDTGLSLIPYAYIKKDGTIYTDEEIEESFGKGKLISEDMRFNRLGNTVYNLEDPAYLNEKIRLMIIKKRESFNKTIWEPYLIQKYPKKTVDLLKSGKIAFNLDMFEEIEDSELLKKFNSISDYFGPNAQILVSDIINSIYENNPSPITNERELFEFLTDSKYDSTTGTWTMEYSPEKFFKGEIPPQSSKEIWNPSDYLRLYYAVINEPEDSLSKALNSISSEEQDKNVVRIFNNYKSMI